VSCPTVEEVLHTLKGIYGNRLSYVEYHLYDVIQIPGSIDLQSYYGAGTMPYAVIHGTESIQGTPDGLQDLFISYIDPILEQTTLVELSDLNIEMSRDQLNCYVQIDLDTSVSTQDLYLKYVLVDDQNRDFPNHAGNDIYNTAIAMDELTLETQSLDQPVEFSLVLMNLPFPMPNDLTLMVWVQTVESTYNENICQVYNVIEKPVN